MCWVRGRVRGAGHPQETLCATWSSPLADPRFALPLAPAINISFFLLLFLLRSLSPSLNLFFLPVVVHCYRKMDNKYPLLLIEDKPLTHNFSYVFFFLSFFLPLFNIVSFFTLTLTLYLSSSLLRNQSKVLMTSWPEPLKNMGLRHVGNDSFFSTDSTRKILA